MSIFPFWIISLVMTAQKQQHRNAIVILDPVTEWKPVLQAAARKNNMVVLSVQLSPIDDHMRKFLPTRSMLKEAGAEFVLDLQDRDIFSCAQKLKVLEQEQNLVLRGVIPLAETAVDFSDTLCSLLGIRHHNPLDLALARRDKGFMKQAVQARGLRVATYARVGSVDDMRKSIQSLALTLPVVIKTPQGFSTTDVYVCETMGAVESATRKILNGKGPDGRSVQQVLLEEYIGGTEFAVNVLAFDGHVTATNVWKYTKSESARYDSAIVCDMEDPGLADVISYALGVAKAVGVEFGAGHVELKAQQSQTDPNHYIDPVMMEVGARLSGGMKTTMTKEVLRGTWDPFDALIAAHCGEKPELPASFSPRLFCKHLFLPIPKSGIVRQINLDLTGLTTVHSSAIMVQEGEAVKETTDIVSCAGFVWLVGQQSKVEQESELIRTKFTLEIE